MGVNTPVGVKVGDITGNIAVGGDVSGGQIVTSILFSVVWADKCDAVGLFGNRVGNKVGGSGVKLFVGV
jgi:hypothetical protein